MISFMQSPYLISLHHKVYSACVYHLHKNKNLNFNLIHRFKYSFSRFYSNMSSTKTCVVAVGQMTSKSDKEQNFNTCKSLIEKAKERKSVMVFLPECFDFVGESKDQAFQLAEPLSGPLISKYKELAKRHCIWLSLGGFHEKGPASETRRVYNAHIIINCSGDIVAVYRKIHLFDIDVPGVVRLRESDFSIPGSQLPAPVDTPAGKIGLGICYDLRFPEYSLCLTKSGADILTYPSAFTQTTGMAHWEPLLRARAIETQCYVIAAAQTGRHNQKRTSYGHAMVVDPWGCVVACCREGTDIVTAEIDLEYISKVRTEMPVWNHRRTDLYQDIFTIQNRINDIDMCPSYKFGTALLNSSQLFYKTQFSMAFVNLMPVIPGHVLVSSIRCVERLADLSPVEVSDLFSCVQKVQRIIEDEHNASSSSIAIQDGPEAGQSIPHIHVHILPRKPDDFERNNDIYELLETYDKDSERIRRSEEDMAAEAENLRKYFY